MGAELHMMKSLQGPFQFAFDSVKEKGAKRLGWVHPAFVKYGEFGVTMTAWLYGDPASNPVSWESPEDWHRGPRLACVKRNLNFVVATGATGTTTTNIWGGKNAVVYSRTATIKPTAVPATARILPNEDLSYIIYTQLSDDGKQVIQDSPIENVFGNTPGQPWISEQPELWWGTCYKKHSVLNNRAASITADLTWTAWVLDTGR
jgi:hypothetical protein